MGREEDDRLMRGRHRGGSMKETILTEGDKHARMRGKDGGEYRGK